MNSPALDPHTRSSHNGITFENYAKRHLKGLELIGGLYDAVYQGRPLDVKSCEEKVSDVYSSNSIRFGRMKFRKEQHEALLAGNGFYFFVVHKGRKVLEKRLVPAKDLDLNFEHEKVVSWRRLFQMVGEVA